MTKQFDCVMPLFLMLAGLLMLAGCMTVGPDYEVPQIPLPEVWNKDVQASEAATDLSEWWRVFGDQVLDELIASAKTNNLDLRQAEARLR